MKKFSLPDPAQFNIKECVIAGDECVLITPKDMGVVWTDENKYFRSSIWRKEDMHPVSLGFRKFTNLGESPEFEPLLTDLKMTAIRKVDGSCLIVSKYKNQLIIRTRGTIDATGLANGEEISLLQKKYPKAFDNSYLDMENYSLLFEWTTPSNRIVLNETKEPTLWLIGMVVHKAEFGSKYRYVLQERLNDIARELEVERPEVFELVVDGNIESLKKKIEPLKDIEGVVIYDYHGQTLKKIKTLQYLYLHKVFTGIKTVDHLFDLFVDYGCPERKDFEKSLTINFDWELVSVLKPLLDELYLRWNKITSKISAMSAYVKNLKQSTFSRKDLASDVIQTFKELSSIAFALLDNKEISPHKLWKIFTNSCN